MSNESGNTLPPLNEIDFDLLKENYAEFLSLAGKSEQERREGILRILDKAKAKRQRP